MKFFTRQSKNDFSYNEFLKLLAVTSLPKGIYQDHIGDFKHNFESIMQQLSNDQKKRNFFNDLLWLLRTLDTLAASADLNLPLRGHGIYLDHQLSEILSLLTEQSRSDDSAPQKSPNEIAAELVKRINELTQGKSQDAYQSTLSFYDKEYGFACVIHCLITIWASLCLVLFIALSIVTGCWPVLVLAPMAMLAIYGITTLRSISDQEQGKFCEVKRDDRKLNLATELCTIFYDSAKREQLEEICRPSVEKTYANPATPYRPAT